MRARDLVTKDNLRKWLKGFLPKDEVGVPRSALSCTIAKFIQTSDYSEALVLDDFWYQSLEMTPYHSLPFWARRFTKAESEIRAVGITAREALAILNKV